MLKVKMSSVTLGLAEGALHDLLYSLLSMPEIDRVEFSREIELTRAALEELRNKENIELLDD